MLLGPPNLRGPSFLVTDGCIVLVTICLVLARDTRVLDILAASMCPAVSQSNILERSDDGSKRSRRLRRSFVGPLKTRATAGDVAATIGIGLTEKYLKLGHGFLRRGKLAPLTARRFEETCSFDDVVSHTDYGSWSWNFATCRREDDSFFQLCEQDFDRCGRRPGLTHARVVGIQFILSDDAVMSPEVRKELQRRDISESNRRIVKCTDVHWMNCVDEHVAKRLVDVVIRAEGRELCLVLTNVFRDLKSCSIRSMHWVDRRIDGSNKSDIAVGEFGVTSRSHGERQMTVDAITSLRRNRRRVAVQLRLRELNGCVAWRSDAGSNG